MMCFTAQVVLFCFVACVTVRAQVNQPPAPYNFAYEHVDDKTGAKVTQSESGDSNNVKTGSYGINDPTGIYRLVQYIADSQGFRVTVDTNEPGTKTHDAANARYTSKAANTPVAVVAPPKPVPVVRPARLAPITTVHAVHSTPLTFHAIPVTVHALHAVPVAHAVHTRHAVSPSYIHFTLGTPRKS
ncbi:hypothetical protein HPB50_015325 [Hyalomma asiaticum]|uniref:Uncharacterized protein n=1 Tax=Hyalomma asiaticum TaxID=266040 RepID=A0ACB7T232_HYAAI|nr:hypothetical protein HPB50_015325 [Hyalomma asiaticum]